jgi:hypothetical protein
MAGRKRGLPRIKPIQHQLMQVVDSDKNMSRVTSNKKAWK